MLHDVEAKDLVKDQWAMFHQQEVTQPLQDGV